MLFAEDDKLVFRFDDQLLWIQPWGENAFRIRATKQASMPTEDWALSENTGLAQPPSIDIQAGKDASISNGKIKATVSHRGKIIIYDSKGKKLLEEYARHRRDPTDPKCSALEVEARELRPILGGDFHLTMRFESLDAKEKIFGMGQYQQPFLNLKGADLELAHRNSQASVPFAVSSLGYGFLWNNPGLGRAVLGTNTMSFEAFSTKSLDYWVVAGDTPAEIEEAYSRVTGHVPMMPEYGLGFWQCKLRYWNQEQLLEVAREHRRRKVPLDVIVADFFHWKHQGEWSFDPKFWPDPGMAIQPASLSETKLTTPHRRNGQRAQRNERGADGINLANRREPLRELPRDARTRTPHPARPRHANRHAMRRRRDAFRRDEPRSPEVHLGKGQKELLRQGHQSLLARRG